MCLSVKPKTMAGWVGEGNKRGKEDKRRRCHGGEGGTEDRGGTGSGARERRRN